MSKSTHVDQAAHWFLRLQDESADARTFLEWQRWLTASPKHREAYEEVEETILRMGHIHSHLRLPSSEELAAMSRTPAKELAADAYDGSVSVSEWKRSTAKRSGWSSRVAYALAASLVAVGLFGAWVWLGEQRASQYTLLTYATTPGERQTFTLAEGSQITLDADSSLDVVLMPNQRSLRLTRGEAYFQVSKDPERPFIVNAGRTQVRAVGTAFNVRMSDKRTVVAVVEGKVEVTAGANAAPAERSKAAAKRSNVKKRDKHSTTNESQDSAAPEPLVTQLGAGEAIAYTDGETLDVLPALVASLATTWMDGRRQYRNEPLRDVLADIDRYTGQRIQVADAATGDLKFTGTLNLENSDAWLKGLAIALPVVVTGQDGVLVVAVNKKPERAGAR